AAALPVVERAAKNMSAQQNEEPVGSLLLALARFQYDKGNAEEGKKHVLEYLRVVEHMNVRYSGDYGLYRRKQQLQTAAQVMVKAGQLADALELLGQALDIPTMRYNYGETAPVSLAALVGRQLAERPVAERYELLRAWMMPAANRKSVRIFGTFLPE